MRAGKRCGEPPLEQRAVYNSDATLDKYNAQIKDAVRHWEKEKLRAGRVGSGALLAMSNALVNNLTDPMRDWNRLRRKVVGASPAEKRKLEFSRRIALSALGISMFLRLEWGDNSTATPEAVGEENQLETILDLVADNSDPSKWKDFRVHTPVANEGALPHGATEQWYQEKGLWVRQARPVDPTEYLTGTLLPSMGIEPDLSGHETLFPYVATK